MADKLVISKSGATLIPLTPEEEAQRLADASEEEARKAAIAAEEARLQEIKASTFVDSIETAIRGKTYAEINAYIDGMTAAQRDTVFKGLVLKWALEVK